MPLSSLAIGLILSNWTFLLSIISIRVSQMQILSVGSVLMVLSYALLDLCSCDGISSELIAYFGNRKIVSWKLDVAWKMPSELCTLRDWKMVSILPVFSKR
jgi:hypothetical protein